MALALSKKLWGLTLLKKHSAEPVRASGGKRFLLPVFLGLGLVVMALLHVWLRLQVVHLGYVLSTGSKLQSQLQQENRELKLELATLTSPGRLEAMARARLGMIEPVRAQVVVLP
jgi:cell division protein FtsL